MNIKRKIIALSICIVVLAGTILSGTIAYFTDNKAITNEFTSGNVKIDLTEYTKDALGTDIVVVPTEGKSDFGKIYPNDTIAKRPEIKLIDNSDDAYIAAKITVSAGDLSTITAVGKTKVIDANGKLEIKKLLSGGILDDAEVCTTPAAVKTAVTGGKNALYSTASAGTYTFYLLVSAKQTYSDPAVPVILFDELHVPANWDHAEMNLLKNLNIKVEAFAVQAKHLVDCHDAMVSAFGDTDFAAIKTA